MDINIHIEHNGDFIWISIYILNISRSVLLRMRNVLDQSYRGNQNTLFVFHNFFFENREIM